MASEGSGDATTSISLPEPLRRWLDEKADREGVSREDVLLQLVSAYRRVEDLEVGAVDDGDGDGPLPGELEERIDARVRERVADELDERVADELDERVADDGALAAALDERVEAVVDERVEAAIEDREGTAGDERLEAFEAEFRDLIEDVRERVVQVKRETDEKAPADHDHPELADEGALEAVRGDLDDAEDAVATLEDDLAALRERLDAGFDNYEEVLEHLLDRTETVADRQRRLAAALQEAREQLRTLAARDAARSAVEDLKRAAGQQGVRTADCEDCGATVDVGLLARAECPHCTATFVDVDPSSGLFGSDTLLTGDRPALAPGSPEDDGGFEFGVDDIAEAEAEDGPAVGVDDGEADE